jgi:hypothetical protein
MQRSGPYPAADPSTGKQGYGASPLPYAATEADLKKLNLKPGGGFIAPDGKTRYIPYPAEARQ